MLDAKKDHHVDYAHLLKPPAGYTLERAIATTYSLDLQALLSIPVAMFYSKPLEVDFDKNGDLLDVFDSIERASEIVTIFCQKGKIKVPAKFNKLINFTEKCVKQITPKSAFSSFHPKCWWLWFYNHNTKEKIVRFAALSRNLTFDRCWDISFYFEGRVTAQKQVQNKGFIDMLAYLEGESGFKIEPRFISDLARTDFKSDLPITEWDFYPIGISKKHQNPLLNEDFKPERLIMMSPFVQDKSIVRLTERTTGDSFLFSRRCDLAKLKPGTFDEIERAFCIPEVIVNGEFDDTKTEQLPNAEPAFLDLHAKLYIAKVKKASIWYLGSANLSEPAFTRNIECLLRFSTPDATLSFDSIFKDLVSAEKEPRLFKEYIPSKIEPPLVKDDLEEILRMLEYDIINCPITGSIIHDTTSNCYSYEIAFNAITLHTINDIKVFLQPLNNFNSAFGKPIQPGILNTLLFDEGYSITQLTKYFSIQLVYKNKLEKCFLLLIDIELPAHRNAKIIADIINSREKFLQYLQFLLSDWGIVEESHTSHSDSPRGSTGLTWMHNNIPLYEELLRTASGQPQKLIHIDKVINKLLEDETTKTFISPDFLTLWNVVKEAVR